MIDQTGIDDEIKAYEAMQPNLEAEHMGEWVVMRDRTLVGVYNTAEGASAEALRLFGRGPYLIRQIGAPPLRATVMIHPDTLTLEQLDALILTSGAHPNRSNGLCAMEAAAWLAGDAHSDHPDCVSSVIGTFIRSWNDALPDDSSRNRLLKPLLPLILDTKAPQPIELARSYLAVDWLARECAPAFLSLRDDLKGYAMALRGLKPLTDWASRLAAQGTLAAARAAARDDAARAALAPIVTTLQDSASNLMRRMIALR